MGASQAWAGIVVEYSQLPTYITANISASPTVAAPGVITPGFVCRETVEIYETDTVNVEVLV